MRVLEVDTAMIVRNNIGDVAGTAPTRDMTGEKLSYSLTNCVDSESCWIGDIGFTSRVGSIACCSSGGDGERLNGSSVNDNLRSNGSRSIASHQLYRIAKRWVDLS